MSEMNKYSKILYSNFKKILWSWISTQNHINSNNKINLLKTHQAFGSFENFPFTDSSNTLGAIYLVRDPRDVLISYAKHMNQGIDKTLYKIEKKFKKEMKELNYI